MKFNYGNVEINKSMKHRVKLFEYFEGDDADNLRDVGLLGKTRYHYTLTGKVAGYKYENGKACEWRLREEIDNVHDRYDKTLEITAYRFLVVVENTYTFYWPTVEFTSELEYKELHDIIKEDVSYLFEWNHFTLKTKKL